MFIYIGNMYILYFKIGMVSRPSLYAFYLFRILLFIGAYVVKIFKFLHRPHGII